MFLSFELLISALSFLHTPYLKLLIFLFFSINKLMMFHLLLLHLPHELFSFFGFLSFWLRINYDCSIKILTFNLTLIKFQSKIIDIFAYEFFCNVCNQLLFFVLMLQVILTKDIYTFLLLTSYWPSQIPASTSLWISSNIRFSSCLRPVPKSLKCTLTKSKLVLTIA